MNDDCGRLDSDLGSQQPDYMAVSAVFEWTSSELERRTRLSRLEARGTVRLLLKDAGLEPASVNPSQMDVVLRRLLPNALKARGVDDAEQVATTLATGLADAAARGQLEASESAYEVFERLGGRTPPGRTKK